jgi:hypothetical protein
VQAMNGTIAGRPFRLRRGEDGWKQKPSPIIKRQVSLLSLPNLPPPPPCISRSSIQLQFGLRVFDVFMEASDFVVVQFGAVPCPSQLP